MRRLAVLAAALALGVCGQAGAATVTYDEGYVEPAGVSPEESCSRYMACPPPTLRVVDEKAERNDLVLEFTATTVLVRDAAAALEGGSGCDHRPDGAIECPAVQFVTVDAAGGDDRVVSPRGQVLGGEGDDDLSGTGLGGGPGADTLRGGDGYDTLQGGPGPDVVDGGRGSDFVGDDDGPVPAPDRLDGGEGLDTIGFAGRSVPVRVELGAIPQEAGSTAEANVVAGFESAAGGEADDELLGPPGVFERLSLEGNGGDDRIVSRASAAQVRLAGGDGDDEISGAGAGERIEGGEGADRIAGLEGDDDVIAGAGDDAIIPGPGDDRLDGEAGEDDVQGGDGADRVLGGAGDDTADGGRGRDVVAGGGGRDLLRGGPGRDRLAARDGAADDLDCGPGRDKARADGRERARRCESVRRPKRRRG